MSEVLNYINRELSAIGYPELDLSNSQTVQGTIFSLLKLQQKEQLYRNEQTERIKILEQEQSGYEAEIRRLKQKQISQEKEIKQLNLANDLSEKKINSLSRDLANQKEENKKSKLNLQYCKTHYEHDLKKSNTEKIRMREQLAKLTKGAKHTQTAVINGEIHIQALEKPTMYEIVIANYEEREKEIMYENSLLRQIIFDLYSKLIAKANDLSIMEGVFQMPVENVKELVSDTLNTLIDRSFVQVKADLEIQQLKEELGSPILILDQNNRKLQEQKQLLEMALSAKQPAPNFKSDFEENIEELKEEWERLQKDKEQLERERKDFTDAAIRMGVERANLLREKAMLEEDKRAQATAALLNTFPPTPTVKNDFFKKSDLLLSEQLSETSLQESNGIWYESTNPNEDGENINPFDNAKQLNESEILVESKTLNTPITPKSKLYRGVRMQTPKTQSLLESAKTVRKQNVIPSRLARDDFFSSTPK
ncbi:hypothetical protein HDV01_002627 [Terramyces sp. JEL0728]|nr:hypothetical protein HDV01_002627 [Terramyces sp. JEL0728]